jgi:hypothetical protein
MIDEDISKYITTEIPYNDYAIGANEYIKFTADQEKREQLNLSIKDQYQNFNNLGINLLDNDNDVILSDNNIADMIDFVNANYITVNNIDYIIVTAKSIQVVGRYLYELICIDLLNDIIPRILTTYKLSTVDLLSTDHDKIKEYLIQITMDKIIAMRDILSDTNNVNIKMMLYKWSFYLDLFDNDLETFRNEVLTPIIIKYQIQLFANS